MVVKAAPEAAGKLRYAHVLGMMGDAAGVDVPVAEIEARQEFDTEDIGRWYPRTTWLGRYILALGRTRDPRALYRALRTPAIGTGSMPVPLW